MFISKGILWFSNLEKNCTDVMFSFDCVRSFWNKTEIQCLADLKRPACKSSRVLHAFNTSVRLQKSAPAPAVANSTIAWWNCWYTSSNGEWPDETCLNFLSFDALEVLSLDIFEMTSFFSARPFLSPLGIWNQCLQLWFFLFQLIPGFL